MNTRQRTRRGPGSPIVGWLAAGVAVASLCAPQASAFCGMFVAGAGTDLYNEASQVAIARVGDKSTITMKNDYAGAPSEFALVVPVPVVLHEEDVRTVKEELFTRLDAFTAPRLVEYYEKDPCEQPDRRRYMMKSSAVPMMDMAEGAAPEEDLGVTVEAKFDVAEYKIVILSAKESTGLETWLKQNGYSLPEGSAPILAPYVKSQMKFFAAKVDVKKLKKDAQGKVNLSPLQFSFKAPSFELPIRLGMVNSRGLQDLIIFALAENERVVTTNYPNLFIPTDQELGEKVPGGDFGKYYLKLFSTAQDEAGGAAVLTEYAWNTGSCDPCPTPPLRSDELKELGLERGYGVVTRMHARYSNKLFKDDLRLGLTAHKRNFQGRYILRHPWKGPVKCKNPRYGRWGRPSPQAMTGNLSIR